MTALTQYSLFNIVDYCDGKKPKAKRVHYDTPTYTKEYEFWHINPDTGEREYNGDERHIFRIRTLHALYADIFAHCLVDYNLFGDFEKLEIDGMIFWGNEKQAELKNSENLSIKQKVLLHIKLLRLLRKGFSVKEAIEKMKLQRKKLEVQANLT